MVIATLLLLFSIPQMDDTAKVVNGSPAVASDSSTKDSTLVASALPSAPAPKVKADVEPIAPNAAAQPFLAAKPVFTRPRETPRQRKIWYALTVAGTVERHLTPGRHIARWLEAMGRKPTRSYAPMRVPMRFMRRHR